MRFSLTKACSAKSAASASAPAVWAFSLASSAFLDGQCFARSARYCFISKGRESTSTGVKTGISSTVGNVTPVSLSFFFFMACWFGFGDLEVESPGAVTPLADAKAFGGAGADNAGLLPVSKEFFTPRFAPLFKATQPCRGVPYPPPAPELLRIPFGWLKPTAAPWGGGGGVALCHGGGPPPFGAPGGGGGGWCRCPRLACG
mmetsp:Transcript_6163/g.23307  ORF Transcript_6163/g.23307 Transcript_6163/m.23307 type:complete len:202 (-) Transcript_6163:221-826(-)